MSAPGSGGPEPDEPARVMVVDDSAVARAQLVDLLRGLPSLAVVGQAGDGREALALLPRTRPEIVLLDVEMPTLGGLDTLPRLLGAAPDLLVVMVSSLTRHGAEATLRALRLGAADYVAKPGPAPAERAAFRAELAGKLLALAARRRQRVVPLYPLARAAPAARASLVAVGSSTGGPRALFTLVAGLGADLPVPVVVAQHMPPPFTATLAAQLDRLGALPCREAADGEALRAGRLYLAPGHRHLRVERHADGLRARLSDAPAEDQPRPSVDVLLRSAARACDGRVLAVVLTGMGQDGLAGTRAVVAAGGAALAQDEATSVVWGMPGAVARAGLCRAVLPIGDLGARVCLMVDAQPQTAGYCTVARHCAPIPSERP